MVDANYLEVTKDVYAEAAETPDATLCCSTSPMWALPDLNVPERMLAMNYGCGTSVMLQDLAQVERVLYIGVGGGLEALQLAWAVRRPGGVVAVEPVARMRQAARENLEEAERLNGWFDTDMVHLVDGDALALPVDDDSVEVVGQNCLFNIFTGEDRLRALSEVHRVLAPGGRLLLSDPVSPVELPDHILNDPVLRARCLAAPTLEAYLADLVAVGFGTIEIRRRMPYRMLDAKRYQLDGDVLLDSVEVVAHAFPVPDDGPCIFTGRAALYVGEDETFDDGKGHLLVRDVPLQVCDKTAAALEALDVPGLHVTPTTWHMPGGGCC